MVVVATALGTKSEPGCLTQEFFLLCVRRTGGKRKLVFPVFVGALTLVHFLFYVTLQWKMAHQAQRSSSSEVLDTVWVCAFQWFSVAGQHNYEEVCAVVTAVQCAYTRAPRTEPL